jgi:hypothetical protein
MAPDQLARKVIDHRREIEPSVLGGDLCVEHDLHQHIPEFLRQRVEVAAVDRFDGFVGFLDQMRAQRAVRLRSVPRAALRRPQDVHDAYMLTDNLLVNAHVRYIDIDTTGTTSFAGEKVKVDVDVDPYVYMVGLGYKF